MKEVTDRPTDERKSSAFRLFLMFGVVVLASVGTVGGCFYVEMRSKQRDLRARWAALRPDEARRRGDIVIDAIKRFLGDNGRAPADLGVLVPKYLTELLLPPPPYAPWAYHVYQDGQYSLGFGDYGKDGECWYYSSEKADWVWDG